MIEFLFIAVGIAIIAVVGALTYLCIQNWTQ